MRLRRIQGIALSFSNAMHGEQMDLQVLLRLELLVTHVARYVLGLHSVNIDDVLLQIRIVRVYLAALGALGFTALIRVIQLLMISPVSLLMKHRHALDLVLRTGLQHQIQLIAFRCAALL